MSDDRATAYRAWADRQSRGASPLPERLLAAYWEASNHYGPPNCWAGTTGQLAFAIRILLLEVERLRRVEEDDAVGQQEGE